MNAVWNAPKDKNPISRFALWAWILSFSYTLGDALLRITLFINADFKFLENGIWQLLVLVTVAAVALLLHLRRNRHAALVLSIGVGIHELLNQGVYLYSSFFANKDPEALQRMLRLLSQGHCWIYRCLWFPLLTGGYLALRRNRYAWPLLGVSAAGALYQLADSPFLRYKLQSPTTMAFGVFDVAVYASVIVAFLLAYLDTRSSTLLRFDEPGTEAIGARSGALALRKRLRRLLLAGMLLLCLNEFFGAGGLLNSLLTITLYKSLGRTGIRLVACILPCAVYLYSLAPLASPRILMTYAYYEAFVCMTFSCTAAIRALLGVSFMMAIGMETLYIFFIVGNLLLAVLFLAILHTAYRLDRLSFTTGTEESFLAWSTYAVSFLYPLADCILWIMTWAESKHYQDTLSLGVTLPFLKVLLAGLCLFLLPRKDRRSALAASIAAGTSLLLGITYSIRLWLLRGELGVLLLSPSWWVMRLFPAALIVGGYLALYRRRWAPLVLTLSTAGALWMLWEYTVSLDPSFTSINARTTLTIVQDIVPLLACGLAWRDRRQQRR